MSKQSKTNIYRNVLWFTHKNKFEIDFFDALQPRRIVSTNPRYKSGVFHSEKCGRNIQYESGLELSFIKNHLENNDAVLFYWEQPISVPFRRGKIRARTYPDFAVYLRSKNFVIVEVKSLVEMLDHRVQAKTEGLMEFCAKRGFGLLLTDGKHTPEELVKTPMNRKLERHLLSELKNGPLYKDECSMILERCAANEKELYKTIIRHNLKFKPFPFKLQQTKISPVFNQVYFKRKKYDDLVTENFHFLFNSKSKEKSE